MLRLTKEGEETKIILEKNDKYIDKLYDEKESLKVIYTTSLIPTYTLRL